MKKIILILTTVFILVSCIGKPESQKSFEKFMGIIQSGDAKKYDDYMQELGYKGARMEKQEGVEFLLEHYKKVEYKILSVKEEGNTSKINIFLKAPDLSPFMKEVLTEYIQEAMAGTSENEEEFFNSRMKEKINGSNLKYEETEITVTMVKEENKWIISPDDYENAKFMAILIGSLHKLSE